MTKKIIVAPLNWGLGHATRCIPIIKELLLQNAEVVILAGDDSSMSLLSAEFPKLNIRPLKGYEVTYPENGNMSTSMLLQTPKLIKKIKDEHEKIEELVKNENINGIISDNRYGLWSKKVKSVFITHQLNIQTPPSLKFLSPILRNLNYKYISKFNECWIPDIEGKNNLSGKLSELKNKKLKIEHIGPLSRFEKTNREKFEKQYDLMGIVSGPEPQRSHFEKLLFNEFNKTNKKCLLVCGKPFEKERKNIGNIDLASHLPSQMMLEAILSSETIVCRPGYSTIMDLAVLGKKAIFVPTPGQTEQEYLASYHQNLMHFYSQKQKDFNLENALNHCDSYQGILDFNIPKDMLSKKISEFLRTTAIV